MKIILNFFIHELRRIVKKNSKAGKRKRKEYKQNTKTQKSEKISYQNYDKCVKVEDNWPVDENLWFAVSNRVIFDVNFISQFSSLRNTSKFLLLSICSRLILAYIFLSGSFQRNSIPIVNSSRLWLLKNWREKVREQL